MIDYWSTRNATRRGGILPPAVDRYRTQWEARAEQADTQLHIADDGGAA